MSINKLNIAIIGFGEIGQKHFFSINKLKKFYKINAILDVKFEKKFRSFAIKNGINLYSNVKDLLKYENIDFVSICLPSGKHYEFIKKFDRTKINIICEKPLVLKTSELLKIKNFLKKNKKIKLFEVKQLRFSNLINTFKKLYLKKNFGNVNFININIFINRSEKYFSHNNWRGTLKQDGGVLFNQLSHHVDLLFYLFNPKKINKLLFFSNKRKNLETEGSGILVFRINNKCLVNINFSLNAFKKNFQNSFNSIFDNANLSFDFRDLSKLTNFHFKNKSIEKNFLQRFNTNNFYIKFYEEIFYNRLNSKKLANIIDAEKVINFNEEFYKLMRKKWNFLIYPINTK